MNIYNTLLFLNGKLPAAKQVEADFGPTYGNRVASERALRERWEIERDLAALSPRASGVDAAAVGGCG